MAGQTATEGLREAEMLLDCRKLRQAHAAFDRAELAGGDVDRCSAGRWDVAMLTGDFEAAWRESDAIRARGTPDPHRFWNGESLQGARVIVRSLHGLGDAVQMMQYAPRLRKIVSGVIFEVPPRLLPLVRYFHGVDRAVSWEAPHLLRSVDWDVQVEVTELPYVFRTTLPELPIAAGYLELPYDCVRSAAKSMGKSMRPRIGYVWTGGDWNPDRSIPFPILETLLESRSAGHWSLQGGSATDHARELFRSGKMRDANAICGDGLVALASAMANLDLVITVDTLAAHLAGALGKQVWVLLQHAADWRWMTDRADSPWYPSMRLFRQPSPGDWLGLIDRVRGALESQGLESAICERTRQVA